MVERIELSKILVATGVALAAALLIGRILQADAAGAINAAMVIGAFLAGFVLTKRQASSQEMHLHTPKLLVITLLIGVGFAGLITYFALTSAEQKMRFLYLGEAIVLVACLAYFVITELRKIRNRESHS